MPNEIKKFIYEYWSKTYLGRQIELISEELISTREEEQEYSDNYYNK